MTEQHIPLMSKSKISSYQSCSWAFKLHYIDGLQGIITPILQRGLDAHKLLEDYYTMTDITQHENYPMFVQELALFEEFNKKLVASGLDSATPAHRELKLTDEQLKITGIIDRVDIWKDQVVVIDYKSGKVRDIHNYYLELGIYAHLLEACKQLKATHWGVYFIDTGELKLEEVDQDIIQQSLNQVLGTREKIETKEFIKNPKYGCRFCTFYKHGCDGV